MFSVSARSSFHIVRVDMHVRICFMLESVLCYSMELILYCVCGYAREDMFLWIYSDYAAHFILCVWIYVRADIFRA